MVFKLHWNECSECLKIVFFTFLEFLSYGVESVFWESKAKPWKLFKSKVYHGKHFSYLEVKNEHYRCLKMMLFTFLQVFEWQSWKHFLGQQGKAFKTLEFQSLTYESFKKIVVKLPWSQKRIFLMFGNSIFHIFASFQLTNLKVFSKTARKSLQNCFKSKVFYGNNFREWFWSYMLWAFENGNFYFLYKF